MVADRVSLFHAILLGTIQGLTEFLPISSSGHLVLFQRVLGFRGPDLLFDTFLHAGTLGAVCCVFRRDLVSMGRALLSRDMNAPHGRLLLLILLGTIPTALIGFAFRGLFERLFSAVLVAGVMLLVTGLLLFVADRVGSNGEAPRQLGRRGAFLIGIVQGLSLLPGLSRSGSTISTGIFLGVERSVAAQFSFLLSVPSIAGAMIFQVPAALSLDGRFVLPVAVGTLTAALTGYAAIKALLRAVTVRRLSLFSYYCWAVGCGVVLISLIHIFA